jgi:hypothetical protein
MAKIFAGTFGMPTTLIVDPQSYELGALAGPAEWTKRGRAQPCDGRDRS